MEIIKLHASGHAHVEDLVKFAETLKPKNIIPIHTENVDKFEKHFKSNIIKLKDRQRIEL